MQRISINLTLMDNDMIKRITLIAAVCCLMSGCASTSVYNEKVAVYRPDLEGRYIGMQTGSQESPGESKQAGVSAGNADVQADASDPAYESTMLKRGDKIMINLYGTEPSARIEDVIDDNGNVNLPYIGITKIGGLSTYAAEDYIEKMYISGGFYKQIQVSVIKAFEGEFFVRGEVNNKQGVYSLSGDTSLLEAIARAGGPTVFAKLTKVKLIRSGQVTYFNLKKMESGEEAPPLLKPGDNIIVEKSHW